jgi:hypothetical protein
MTFRILGSMPDDQVWAFCPGDVVSGEHKVFADGSTGIVAGSRSS